MTSNPNSASGIHADIDATRKAAYPTAAMLKLYREYTRGRQKGTLTPDQAAILRGVVGNLWCDNLCKMVLAQTANRVQLVRFEAAGQGAAHAALLLFLQDVWVLNGLGALSTMALWAMLRDGDHAVGLRWRDGRPILTRERWWNGDDGMFVAYDDDDRPRYAVSEWTAGKKYRTVWYADKIERYVAEGAGWQLYNRPGDFPGRRKQAQAVPWVDRGEPIGIPVVHFANVQTPNDADADTARNDGGDPRYGMSELDGGVIGLQDETNDVQRDITAAARFTGYQMYYGTGITRDPKQSGPTFEVSPGTFLEEENPAAAFGTLPAGSIAELASTLQIKLQAVSRATGIPMHLIAGEWPSGEALLKAERPLMDKAETIGRFLGPAWASVMHKATRLQNAFGDTSAYGVPRLDDTLLITAVFAPAERRDPLTRAQIATQEAPFVSEEETLRTLGKSPDDIVRIMAERAAARQRMPLPVAPQTGQEVQA